MPCPGRQHEARIFKHFTLSPQQFSKITETTTLVFKTASAYNEQEILTIHHQNHKNTVKKHDYLQLKPLDNTDGERANYLELLTQMVTDCT